MNIKDTFLQLTDHLYPHGSVGTDEARARDFEKRATKLFDILPQDLQKDDYGNLYKMVGDGSTTVMFTSHLDTATQADGPVKHVRVEESGDDVVKTDGQSILGADDKAGSAIMMYMMEKEVPGLYYFFLGEEVGCLGSKWLAKRLEDDKWIEQDLYKNINKVIAFDRKDYHSVISFQNTRTASDKFCDELAKRLNAQDESFKYKTDPTGLYTDSARVAHLYAECTNLSVGYFDQHTKRERQNLDFLVKLAEASVKLDWETLPVERDPKKDNERKSYNYHGSNYGSNYGRNNSSQYNHNSNRNNSSYSSRNKKSSKENTYKTDFWHDDKYEHLMEFNYTNGNLINIDICQERVDFEVRLIKEVFDCLEIPYKKLNWDGVELEVKTDFNETEMTRQQLYEFVPELKYDMI
ncbi:MAG: putative peptidase [uncultured marine phage]|uniref:Putative peptidase n=1 Tax=uncultured marine phage TaxID=707152 RepID=A0A8D9CD25_9VIRU|nr:MAG: putative peptidase [uncultured marine phage]